MDIRIYIKRAAVGEKNGREYSNKSIWRKERETGGTNYSAGPVIGPPAYRANSVIGPSKGLHQVSAIMRELREAIGGFKQHKYDFGDTNGNEFIF